jgi:hypothetical protein
MTKAKQYGTNQYGLDVDYFRKKLFCMRRDAENYTPAEMKRELLKLKMVAERQEFDSL